MSSRIFYPWVFTVESGRRESKLHTTGKRRNLRLGGRLNINELRSTNLKNYYKHSHIFQLLSLFNTNHQFIINYDLNKQVNVLCSL